MIACLGREQDEPYKKHVLTWSRTFLSVLRCPVSLGVNLLQTLPKPKMEEIKLNWHILDTEPTKVIFLREQIFSPTTVLDYVIETGIGSWFINFMYICLYWLMEPRH